ncbi:MAG: hypothetical protein R6V10_05485 [bacterium]
MACEFLMGRQVKLCGAFNSHVVLSVDELEQKCMSKQYHTCGIYRKCKSKGTKLPLQEYKREYKLPTF